ncbi:MAG: sulfatase-like hydrolase/transferase [Planctomycetales bacterium]|nr:sulfatase-like hydrolase/transferase [Planctomycetales bacterium]
MRSFLIGWVSLGCSFMLLCPTWAKTPNVLLVITDDQGYGDVGFHGNSMIHTPTMDSLARQSLRLTNFHVEPTCAETRSALMSGQFPLRVGVWHTIMGRSIMRADAVTMPQVFRQAGYRTGMFGKWHLGDNYPYRPQDRGFDVTLNHGGGGVGQTPDTWGNHYFDDVYLSAGELTPVRGYCTDVFFDAAKQFITTKSDKPFFCYLATNAPHGPYNVADSYKQPYLDQGVSEPMASFYGMITNIDDNLAKLLRLLDERQLSRDTVVVFMTDNGTAAGYRVGRNEAGPESKWNGYNAGMRGTKGQQYEGGHRVPCFIRFPDGRFAGRDYSALSAHVDLLPTLAAACGIGTSPTTHLDGINLLPLVESLQSSSRTLVVQSHRVEAPVQWTKSAVMTDNWRLVDGAELYSMADDPGQETDLANTHPQVVDQLRQAYLKWWDDCRPDSSQYSRIPLGDPAAPQAFLTGHDWHGPAPPWNQRMIASAPATNGSWEVTVVQPGRYQILLARQPLEEPRALNCSQVEVSLNDIKVSVSTDPKAVLAPVTVQLQPGDYRLSSRLIGSEHGDRDVGAFYAYVHFLGRGRDLQISAPSWLRPGDRIAWLGGTLIERAQANGAMEAELLARAPEMALSFCNLGWSGDDVTGQARAVFGTPEEGKQRRMKDLELAAPSVVVVAYGMSEALSDEMTVEQFREQLAELINALQSSQRRVVLCHPPKLKLTTEHQTEGIPWKQVTNHYASRQVEFAAVVDQLATTLAEPGEPLAVLQLPDIETGWFESAQYLSQIGYRNWTNRLASGLLGDLAAGNSERVERLSELSRDAHHSFFEMHRPQNETYLYLFRKHEQGNNGVEPFQYRPLLSATQIHMLQVAAEE